MSKEIDQYNADAQELATALNAAGSDFTWKIRTWSREQEIRATTPYTEAEIAAWKRDYDREPLSFEERLEIEMETLLIVAETKKSHGNNGKLTISQHLSRKLLKDTLIDAVALIIGMADREYDKALFELGKQVIDMPDMM